MVKQIEICLTDLLKIPVIKELKDGLIDLGADKDDYDSIIDFAKALEHPVKSSSGKVSALLTLFTDKEA